MDTLFEAGGTDGMTWIKLEDDIFQHPKILAAGPQASFLFIASLCWSGRNDTGGAIPDYALRRLASDIDVSETTARELAEKLVNVSAPGSTAGLWEMTLDGWVIHDWGQWQTSSSERNEKRALAERKRRLAHSKSTRTPLGSGDCPLSSGSDQGEPWPLEVEVEREVEKPSLPPPTPPSPPYPAGWEADFAELWKVYPRTLSRKAALRCYVSTRRRGNSHEDLLLATENFAKAMKADGRDPKLIKHGSTFFGPDEHWRDYLPGGAGLTEARAKREGSTYVDSNGNTVQMAF